MNSIAVSLPEGWVLQVNKCLPDQIDSDEAIPPSGSERTAKVPVLHGSDVSSTAATAATATKEVEPCLFHSYTARCAKGQHCEYSHAIHADQVILPQQHKRGKARQKIRTDVQRCAKASKSSRVFKKKNVYFAMGFFDHIAWSIYQK